MPSRSRSPAGKAQPATRPAKTTGRKPAKAKPVGADGEGSLRERSKLDKRRRILEAAREVIVERGYEAATTREIAARAGVSIGTVFVYATDKRDLLLQVVNDELEAVSAKAHKLVSQTGPLPERLIAYFRLRYRYWAGEPMLSRPALHETAEFLATEDKQGREATRFYARRPVMRSHIEQMVRAAQEAGEVVDDVPAEELASLIFSLYLIEVRRWLHDDPPRLAVGIARLDRVLRLFMRGVLKTPGR